MGSSEDPKSDGRRAGSSKQFVLNSTELRSVDFTMNAVLPAVSPPLQSVRRSDLQFGIDGQNRRFACIWLRPLKKRRGEIPCVDALENLLDLARGARLGFCGENSLCITRSFFK